MVKSKVSDCLDLILVLKRHKVNIVQGKIQNFHHFFKKISSTELFNVGIIIIESQRNKRNNSVPHVNGRMLYSNLPHTCRQISVVNFSI